MQNTRVSQEQTGVLAGLIIMNESLSNQKTPLWDPRKQTEVLSLRLYTTVGQ